MGRRSLPLESLTARADVRVREVFVQVPQTSKLIQRRSDFQPAFASMVRARITAASSQGRNGVGSQSARRFCGGVPGGISHPAFTMYGFPTRS